MEGPFGDHTGFYTPPEEFPLFRVSAITMRRDAIYPSIVVGKPPAEDEWLAKATERIFLPAIRMSVPELVDYDLPTAGTFHNCVIVSIRKRYPGHARKVMHAVWGLGLLSLAKAVVVVDEHVDVHDYQDRRADRPARPRVGAAVLRREDRLRRHDERPRRRGARVAARDRDDGRGSGARRRTLGRARVASALRPGNRAEWSRRGTTATPVAGSTLTHGSADGLNRGRTHRTPRPRASGRSASPSASHASSSVSS
jgi:hypothetical protein